MPKSAEKSETVQEESSTKYVHPAVKFLATAAMNANAQSSNNNNNWTQLDWTRVFDPLNTAEKSVLISSGFLDLVDEKAANLEWIGNKKMDPDVCLMFAAKAARIGKS